LVAIAFGRVTPKMHFVVYFLFSVRNGRCLNLDL